MYRVIFLLVTLALCSSLKLNDECKKLSAPHVMKCCKHPPEEMGPFAIAKECMVNMKPPPNCDVDICVAKKLSYAGSEDGKFDKKALEETINTSFEKTPELAESIVKTCINGDLSDFGPPDFCDLAKFRHCVHAHLVVGCPEWDTSDAKCAETKELVEKCSKD